jgi:hypothetical protein
MEVKNNTESALTITAWSNGDAKNQDRLEPGTSMYQHETLDGGEDADLSRIFSLYMHTFKDSITVYSDDGKSIVYTDRCGDVKNLLRPVTWDVEETGERVYQCTFTINDSDLN